MKKFLFFLLIFCYKPLLSQINNENLVPTIEYKTQENLVILNSNLLSKEQIVVELNYLFLVVKQTNGNLSNQKQEGKFIINPNEKINLSEIRLDFNDNTKIKAYLFIRDENQNKLISKDSLQIDFNDKLNLKNTLDNSIRKDEYKNEEFIIRGLVTDQTKTKMGRDFFEIFYSRYNLQDEKFPFMIEILEQPIGGRNTRISVFVDDKSIYNFNLTPNEDYMRNINNDLFKILFLYNKNRTIINSY